MKSVKPSANILKGLKTGFNMDVSAPHLVPNGSLATVALVDAV